MDWKPLFCPQQLFRCFTALGSEKAFMSVGGPSDCQGVARCPVWGGGVTGLWWRRRLGSVWCGFRACVWVEGSWHTMPGRIAWELWSYKLWVIEFWLCYLEDCVALVSKLTSLSLRALVCKIGKYHLSLRMADRVKWDCIHSRDWVSAWLEAGTVRLSKDYSSSGCGRTLTLPGFSLPCGAVHRTLWLSLTWSCERDR